MSLENRIENAEDALQPDGPERDYLITICEEQWIFGPDDVPIPIHREPVGYTTPQPGGFGSPRIFVRRAIYGDDAGKPLPSSFDQEDQCVEPIEETTADHGIQRDAEVTGD